MSALRTKAVEEVLRSTNYGSLTITEFRRVVSPEGSPPLVVAMPGIGQSAGTHLITGGGVDIRILRSSPWAMAPCLKNGPGFEKASSYCLAGQEVDGKSEKCLFGSMSSFYPPSMAIIL